MIRKFNLTNGVSVVITEELAEKYELDNVHSDSAFVSVLAAIVSAQECKEVDLNGGVPLRTKCEDATRGAVRGMIEVHEARRREVTTPNMSDAEEAELKIRYFGDYVETDDTVEYFD